MAAEKKVSPKKLPAKAKLKKEKQRHRVAKFIAEVFAEIKMITWPTPKQVVIYTGAVLVFVLVFVVVIGVLDFGMGNFVSFLTGQNYK